MVLAGELTHLTTRIVMLITFLTKQTWSFWNLTPKMSSTFTFTSNVHWQQFLMLCLVARPGCSISNSLSVPYSFDPIILLLSLWDTFPHNFRASMGMRVRSKGTRWLHSFTTFPMSPQKLYCMMSIYTTHH